MTTRRVLPFAAILALSLAACSPNAETKPSSSTSVSNDKTPNESPNEDTPNTDSEGNVGAVAGTPVGLVRFPGCDEVLDYVKSQALEHVGPYGLDGQGPIIMEDAMASTEVTVASGGDSSDAGAPSATVADSPAPDEQTSETGTNVQETGVDEPDIIKTDGKRIITLTGMTLTVSDISERVPRVTGSLTLLGNSQPSDMVLAGDRVLVFSVGGGLSEPMPSADAEAEFAPDDSPPAWLPNQTIITEISIAEAPSIVNTMRIEGDYLSARSVANRLRVAVSSPPASLPWVVPQSPAGEDRAEESNREIVQQSTLADWLPDMSVNGAEPTPLLNCDSIRRPAKFAGFDTISIVDIDLGSGLSTPADAVGVMASGHTVYSSTDRFYVASTDWNWDVPMPADGGDDVATTSDLGGFGDATTGIHAFSISDTEPTSYVGSGDVNGSLLNQFAMDSYEGNLRVLTTSTKSNGDTETFLRVLAEQGDRLVEIGSVGGLGKGEQLYSARLFDDVGFAVTFRQIDPLYVLDLSDPANPRVTGELKIPGVSTYLHPLGGGRLLGVGANATDEGARTGLKVSVFDVSDVANPTEISNWTLEGVGSNAEYDYHAFQYSDGLLVLPLEPAFNGESGTPTAPEAVVLRVGDTIDEVGRITIESSDAEPTSDCRVVPGDTELSGVPVDEMFGTNVRLQVCSADDTGGFGDYRCETATADDSGGWPGSDEDTAALGLGPTDRLELCFPDDGYWANRIQRVLSINDTFYTFTSSRLQANDRASLDLLGSVGVGG